MRNCKWCNKEITKKPNIFCDRLCLQEWNNSLKVKMTCSVCYKPYLVPESRSIISKVCSHKCRGYLAGIGGRKANIAKAEVVSFDCLNCKNPFQIYKSRSLWEKNGTQGRRKFCCKVCQLQYRKISEKKVAITCIQCGKVKSVDPYRIKAKYCSVQCKNDFQKTLTGTKSASYKNGHKTYRRDALELYQSKCICCGKAHARLHVHHIDGNNKNNVPSNWAVLCPTCHRRVHLGRLVLPFVVVPSFDHDSVSVAANLIPDVEHLS